MTRTRALSAALLSTIALVTLPSAASAALRAPSLGAPASGERVEGVPALTWSAVSGAASYEYQLAADEEFGSIVLGSGAGKGTSKTQNTAATIEETLPDGEYFWRVRAIDSKDRAGHWSGARTLRKEWTTAPLLIAPVDGASVVWPASPLVLNWSGVPYATRYIVSIATDASMSALVLGTSTSPQTTQGTSYALPRALASGKRYHWAITPIDAAGHRGQRSKVASFTWTWPTATSTRLADLDSHPGVFDPQFSWDAVPGAASYEIDVNFTENFSPEGRVCCTDKTTGASLSPTKLLRNNEGVAGFGYYWRVRAFDADGNAGQWNHRPETDFTKTFHKALPSIPGLRVTDNTETPPAGSPAPVTSSPAVQWDPVAGASSYEVHITPWVSGSSCDWSSPARIERITATNAWSPVPPKPTTLESPGPLSWPTLASNDLARLANGVTYCARVLARSDREGVDSNGYISPFTQLAPAFTYTLPEPATAPPLDQSVPADTYLYPTSGTLTPRTPLVRWKRIAWARAYFVVIARDEEFTHVVDIAYTDALAYAPRLRNDVSKAAFVPLADETTSYYWAVMPVSDDGVTASVTQNHPQSFDKRSFPSALLEPAAGAVVGGQPTFRWTPADGARRYQLQVSQDATFSPDALIDDVTTALTAFTSSTTYPSDAIVYWRVRVLDENLRGQGWSCAAAVDGRCPSAAPPGSFQRTLPAPAPAPGNPTGGEGIPVLSWSPVTGAVSYTLHVAQTDGKEKEFTVASTSFTPTTFYGNGIWHWKVKANFPTTSTNKVSGGFFPAQDYVRLIGRTPNVRGVKTATRVLLSWDPDPEATRYRVDISSTTGFGQAVESTRTQTTSFAPDLSRRAYQDGGTLYWRVASVDDGNNTGAWTTGHFTFPKGINVALRGRLRRGQAGAVTVRLRDAKGNAVSGAKVRVTGKRLRSVSRRSGKDGLATFRLRPGRRGTLTFRVTRKGYRDATATLLVG